jgi:hypothetical protein
MLITLDTSLNCTAIIIDDKKHVFVNRAIASGKTKLKKWFEVCQDQIEYHFIDYDIPTNYSKKEVYKIQVYSEIASSIASLVKESIKQKTQKQGFEEKLFTSLESYSYSSSSGPLIDLVTLGTLIRRELLDLTIPECFETYAPASLKLEAAKLTYPPTPKGKKLEYRNQQGVSGGDFNKFDIYKALIENPSLSQDSWIQFLLVHRDEIFETRSVPKPIEDINDAKMLYEIEKVRLGYKIHERKN